MERAGSTVESHRPELHEEKPDGAGVYKRLCREAVQKDDPKVISKATSRLRSAPPGYDF
jgi:hypothetical protein